MKPNAAFRILAVLFLSLAWCTAADEPSNQLRVMSYNIHIAKGVDGKLDLERIARVIVSEKPDIVALQEVDQITQRTGKVDQAAELSKLTGMHVAFGKALELQGGKYGIALLSKFPIIDPETHPLPSTPGSEPRVLLTAKVKPPQAKSEIFVMATHLDHRDNPSERKLQVAWIRKTFPPGKPALPAIFAGDFNDVPKSEVIQSVIADWRDTAAEQSFTTFPSKNPNIRIDYIFVRPANAWRVVETRTIPEEVASDHRPVLTVLELSSPEPEAPADADKP